MEDSQGHQNRQVKWRLLVFFLFYVWRCRPWWGQAGVLAGGGLPD